MIIKNISDYYYKKILGWIPIRIIRSTMGSTIKYHLDKITLLNNMHDLDDKRTKTLEKCFESVKSNLSKVFNDLLPGATAHINLID